MRFLLQHGFEQAAARTPAAPALAAPDGAVVSYAALERASRGLALGLLASGLAPGARVGVWMRKSPAAVTAMLAALRAGGVYVPLDPFAPAARIARLAADCRLQALCADPGLESGDWAAPPPLHLDSGDARWRQWTESPGTLPSLAATGADLAYILYTSGSTGEPKGVMHTHAHALNFLDWASAGVQLGARDRLASHAPFHFDLSIFDLWAGLSAGAQVCLLDAVTARFPAAVADWIATRAITVWYSVPTALMGLLDRLHQLAALRVVIFAGEVFPPAGLAQLRAGLPAAALHNWYGPTETNVCTAYRLPAAPPLDPLPIGAPCANFACEVLDSDRRPVAVGQRGLLWVRSPHLMAGYWGDPARTAASMWLRESPDGAPPQRLYCTGDIVSLAADGLYRYHGRGDDLVKCRGYRISLLEVQRCLEGFPGVRQAVVLAGPDPAQAQSLRAVLVAPAALEEAALRDYCAAQLPGWMIPDSLVTVAQLPLTPNGKVDRARLLAAWQSAALAEVAG